MMGKNRMNSTEQAYLLMSPGTTLVYHVGCLASDRYGNHRIHQLARVLLRLAERGEGVLTQRRLNREQTEYRFTRAGRLVGRPSHAQR